MSKYKVILLGKLPPPYIGPAIATEILINSVLKEEFELYHLNTNVHQDFFTMGRWKTFKIKKNIKIYWHFFKLIVRSWPDIILIPISQTTLGFVKDSFFIIISRIFKRTVLLQLRGSNIKNWLNHASWITRFYVGLILKITEGAIVLSDNLKYLLSCYFPKEKIFVVPNGADYNYHFSKKRNLLPKILYLSNFLPSKGIEDVLTALMILKKVHKVEYTADFVGSWHDDDIKKRCLLRLQQNRLPIVIHSAKIGKEKRAYFTNADIFVFPPREPEGLPWVLIEAIAAGLPIISTDQGAISDLVVNEVNGFIVNKNNPKQIADKIKVLIENPSLRIQMGKKSRLLYLKSFTEEKMVEQMSFVFNNVLKCK